MANGKMKILVSPNISLSSVRRQGQKINFINATEGSVVLQHPPERLDYNSLTKDNVATLSYRSYAEEGDSFIPFGLATFKSSDTIKVSVFKQEGYYDQEGNFVPLTDFVEVVSNSGVFNVDDYNIGSNRTYKYIVYPAGEGAPLEKIEQTIDVKWGSWSITELHPLDASMKRFHASPEDVWLFTLNLEAGEQTQNIARSEQKTLGQFSRYANGATDFVSSNISCLLGSEILPASYLLKNGEYIQQGGYMEKLPYAPVTSNDKVDMLYAWRKLVRSNNPKLLKDPKGQKFIVVLTDASNKTNEKVPYRPDTISFNWKQVADAEGVQIFGEVAY